MNKKKEREREKWTNWKKIPKHWNLRNKRKKKKKRCFQNEFDTCNGNTIRLILSRAPKDEIKRFSFRERGSADFSCSYHAKHRTNRIDELTLVEAIDRKKGGRKEGRKEGRACPVAERIPRSTNCATIFFFFGKDDGKIHTYIFFICFRETRVWIFRWTFRNIIIIRRSIIRVATPWPIK